MIHSEAGMTLVEVIISLAVLGVVLAGLILGLSTATLAVGRVDERSTAVDLAQSQIELVKSTPYTDTISAYPTVTPPNGYVTTITGITEPSGSLQIVTATVTFGTEQRLLFQVAAYKSNVIP